MAHEEHFYLIRQVGFGEYNPNTNTCEKTCLMR
jgi:hypothetical protein